MAADFDTIDDYISSFPDQVRIVLEDVRRTIREVLGDGGETISYGIPIFTMESISGLFGRLEELPSPAT